MNSNFPRTLNYASVNEDWRTEAAGLRIGSSDIVLCVTGSGARPLDLLAVDPAGVVAIDMNATQNQLLQLKVGAMRELPYEEYVAFLGLRSAAPAWRWETWRGVSASLPASVRAFWNERPRMIRSGIIYQGRWERFYQRVAVLARTLRPRAIPALFEFQTLEEQRAFIRGEWDTRSWRAAYRVVCSPLTSRLFFGDPGFYLHVSVPVGRVVYERMRASLERFLARENFMISLCLTGRLPEGDLPPHLTQQGYATIRERLDRLEIVTVDVLEFLRARRETPFTRFSLSDLPSFLGARQFESLLDGITWSAAPGARVVIRQFLTRYSVPEGFSDRLTREPQLEARLARDDRAFAYDFIVGEVHRV
jgi:S-adenosylmethionine-diacylglycerol 3-amino-3-carboxypropyl transferase